MKSIAKGRKTLLRGMKKVDIAEYMPEKQGEARRNIQCVYLEIYVPLRISEYILQKAK